MDRQITLMPLVCPRCNTSVPAMTEEVAWVCANCGQGMSLDDEHGLLPQLVYYSAEVPPNGVGKPFWVSEGQASLRRTTFSSDNRQAAESQRFWSQPRRFFVPAYQATLEQLLAQGIQYLKEPPSLQEGPPARFAPVTLYLQDVKAAAEFLIVAVEAGRPDKLRELDFELKLSPPDLWILP